MRILSTMHPRNAAAFAILLLFYGICARLCHSWPSRNGKDQHSPRSQQAALPGPLSVPRSGDHTSRASSSSSSASFSSYSSSSSSSSSRSDPYPGYRLSMIGLALGNRRDGQFMVDRMRIDIRNMRCGNPSALLREIRACTSQRDLRSYGAVERRLRFLLRRLMLRHLSITGRLMRSRR